MIFYLIFYTMNEHKNLFFFNYKQTKLEIAISLDCYDMYDGDIKDFLKTNNIDKFVTTDMEVMLGDKWIEAKCLHIYEDKIDVKSLIENIKLLRLKMVSNKEEAIFVKLGGAEFVF